MDEPMDESALVQNCTSEMQPSAVPCGDADKSSNVSNVLDQEDQTETPDDEFVKSKQKKHSRKLMIFDSDEDESPIQEENPGAIIESSLDGGSDSTTINTIKKKKKILKRPLQDLDSSDDENAKSSSAAHGFDKRDVLQSESDETSQGIYLIIVLILSTVCYIFCLFRHI